MRAKWVLAAVLAAGLGWAAFAQDPKEPPKPPEGWKEYTPADKVFTVWVPAGGKRTERSDTVTVKDARFKVNILELETEGKGKFIARTVLVPHAPPPKGPPPKGGPVVKGGGPLPVQAVTEALRDAFLQAHKGSKVDDEGQVKVGPLTGKEYKITIDSKTTARVRVFVTDTLVHEVAVIGTKDQVGGKDADTFLDSYRRFGPAVSDPGLGGETGTFGAKAGTKFKDPGPAGGMLIGLRVWTKGPEVLAVQPLYRVGDKEVPGTTRGKAGDADKPVELKAKEGYAVGGLSAKESLRVRGFALTFMKVGGAGLDPKDQYQTEWVGGKQGTSDRTLGGDGRPVTSVHGAENEGGQLVALGLLLPPAEKAPDPKK